jgi:hypothetical protein
VKRIVLGIGTLVALAGACGGAVADGGDGGKDAAPETQPPPTTLPTTFAVHQVFLGETDRSGALSSSAWKAYGRNVDGLVTTSASTDVCLLTAGSPVANQNDGDNGIDNGWGSTIMPIIQTAASLPTPSTTITSAIQTGAPTLLIVVSGLTDDPAETATGLTGEIFLGASIQDAGAPAFDSSTDWPVLSTSLKDGQTLAGGAIAQFTSGSITSGAFTTGVVSGAVPWSIAFQGVPLPLVIHDAVVTFDHADPTDAVNGTISGVLDTQEFLNALQAVAGSISLSLCGSAFDGIAQQIREAQEILVDGTNAPGVPCTGISIGIGFNAKRVANPTTVVQAPPTANPCGN